MLRRPVVFICLAYALFSGITVAQSEHVRRTLVINGQTGDVGIYRIDGRSYVELEALVRIGNGSMTLQGDTITLTFPSSQEPPPQEPQGKHQQNDSALSSEFMRTSIESLGAIKEWIDTLTYAARRGVPGDGSRIVVLQDRATQTLLLAKAHAISNSDQNALQLLSNNYNTLKSWSDKLIHERRSMDSGKYSLSPDLIERDETYQNIVACTKFLASMIPNGNFEDDHSCH